MSFYSTHQWVNGAVSTVEIQGDGKISIRIQDDKENMLTDIIVGRQAALCIAHSILSVLTHPSADNEVQE